jgi:hypothetical protein
LQYPLNLSEDIASDTPNDPEILFESLEGWTSDDSEERINIVLNLSLDEYVALATSIDVGRDLAYGDNSLYIWWIWIRSLISMNLCESVQDCIENHEGTQEAILALTGGGGSLAELEAINSSGEIKNGDLAAGENAGCDEDTWFGGIDELIERMNALNVDSLEIFEARTNELDFLSDVIGDITVIDETSIDAVLAWMVTLQENIAENYAAQYTTEYADEIKCDLFCLAIEECQLNPDMLFEYFVARLAGSVTWESLLLDVLNYLTGGEWSGTQIADFMMLSQIGFRKSVGFFFGGGQFKDLSLALRVGFRNPSSAWEELCDECATWEFTVDFADLPSGFTITSGSLNEVDSIIGAFVSGNDWNSTIEWDFGSEFNITRIRFNGHITTSNNNGLYCRDSTNSSPGDVLIASIGSGDRVGDTGTIDIEMQTGFARVVGGSSSGSRMNASTLIFNGTGTNPFI